MTTWPITPPSTSTRFRRRVGAWRVAVIALCVLLAVACGQRVESGSDPADIVDPVAAAPEAEDPRAPRDVEAAWQLYRSCMDEAGVPIPVETYAHEIVFKDAPQATEPILDC